MHSIHLEATVMMLMDLLRSLHLYPIVIGLPSARRGFHPTPHFAWMHVWDVGLGCMFGMCQKHRFGKSSLNRLMPQSVLSTTVQEDKTLWGDEIFHHGARRDWVDRHWQVRSALAEPTLPDTTAARGSLDLDESKDRVPNWPGRRSQS